MPRKKIKKEKGYGVQCGTFRESNGTMILVKVHGRCEGTEAEMARNSVQDAGPEARGCWRVWGAVTRL